MARSWRGFLLPIAVATLVLGVVATPGAAEAEESTKPAEIKPAEPKAAEAKAAEPAKDTRQADAELTGLAKKPVMKVWSRENERGNRFLQLGDRDVVSADQLADILSKDEDEEVVRRMKSYSTWRTVSTVGNVLTVLSGVGAFVGWSSSVSTHGSGFLPGGAVTGMAVGVLVFTGLRVVADQFGNRALLNAQAAHNNRILRRPTEPLTSVSPLLLPGTSVAAGLSVGWTF